MASERSAFLKAILSAAFLAATCLPTLATAAPDSLREGLFGPKPSAERRTPNAPLVARYMSENGQSFVLDRSQRRPLLKFDNSPEVWALSSQQAPRGDVIYKNDLGRTVLRTTRLGGVTLFTEAQPAGSAVSLSGAGPPLRLSAIGPQALAERLLQASARASRAARRTIKFEAEAAPESSALIADSAIVAAEALVRLARRPKGQAALARFSKVTLMEGRKTGASVRQGTLQITVTPKDGYGGRPSSERLIAAAMK